MSDEEALNDHFQDNTKKTALSKSILVP